MSAHIAPYGGAPQATLCVKFMNKVFQFKWIAWNILVHLTLLTKGIILIFTWAVSLKNKKNFDGQTEMVDQTEWEVKLKSLELDFRNQLYNWLVLSIPVA